MKKFEKEGAFPDNPNWEKLVSRREKIYERDNEIRNPFDRDHNRILHSYAYRRLKHKTQVFFNAAGNDHICTRIEHVSHVESVSGTIARALGLNEDLTKAIAMAHDLGHASFGHEGEIILRKLTGKWLGEGFWHEKNGLYFVEDVELLEDDENRLRNLNLTYAVRDGIVAHCGELDNNAIRPRDELFDLDRFETAGQYEAATWEGCVVKLSDKIAYLGRDIEDAITAGYLADAQKEELREMARARDDKTINTTVIMHNMILDLCANSSPEAGLCLSEPMSKQLNDIKAFNYKYIYGNPRLEPFRRYADLVLREIFDELHSYYDGPDTLRSMECKGFGRRRFVREFAEWLARYVELSGSENTGAIPDESETKAVPGWALQIAGRCRNRKIYGALDEESQYIRACIDYVAGMTDAYAMECYGQLLEC